LLALGCLEVHVGVPTTPSVHTGKFSPFLSARAPVGGFRQGRE